MAVFKAVLAVLVLNYKHIPLIVICTYHTKIMYYNELSIL